MKNILIIDDDEDFRIVLKDKINERLELNYDITEAPSGLDAIDVHYKRKGLFDIIICDYFMPRGSGMDFINLIRGYDKKVKCVLISGDHRVSSKSYPGVDKVFSKLDLDELIDYLNKNK